MIFSHFPDTQLCFSNKLEKYCIGLLYCSDEISGEKKFFDGNKNQKYNFMIETIVFYYCRIGYHVFFLLLFDYKDSKEEDLIFKKINIYHSQEQY